MADEIMMKGEADEIMMKGEYSDDQQNEKMISDNKKEFKKSVEELMASNSITDSDVTNGEDVVSLKRALETVLNESHALKTELSEAKRMLDEIKASNDKDVKPSTEEEVDLLKAKVDKLQENESYFSSEIEKEVGGLKKKVEELEAQVVRRKEKLKIGLEKEVESRLDMRMKLMEKKVRKMEENKMLNLIGGLKEKVWAVMVGSVSVLVVGFYLRRNGQRKQQMRRT